jgi:UDP-N-acetylglucosamine 1-carboxyvinyltransferase
MDTHFEGIQKLGAKFNYDAENYLFRVDGTDLKGAFILLDEPSVTGTANITMAAALAKGTTTIYNAACEPYNQQLCNMLVSMGAKIKGIGTNKLEIEGVESLGGCTHRCLPDMIEIGSFIGLAAITNSSIRIKNVRLDMLGNILPMFRKMGINFTTEGDDIVIPEQGVYEISNYIDGSILSIADGPWPLFTPDLISIALVTAIQAKGNVLIHQKMFESRLFFVDSLIEMGAQIILNDPHRATVMGLGRTQRLRGISMRSPDIRAGVSLLIAALSAEGESTIHNIVQIDRGYENIDGRLNAMGAHILRID